MCDEKNGMLVAGYRAVAVGLYRTADGYAGKRHYHRLYHHSGRVDDHHRHGAVLRLAERYDLRFRDRNDRGNNNDNDRGIRLVSNDDDHYHNDQSSYHYYDHTAGKAGR